MKILIADDSKTNLTLEALSLESLGHTVIPACSGETAVVAFAEHHPDLVILDVVMEGMTGFETAKQIRALDTHNWIPIIFLSSNVDDDSIKQGIDAGGDDYLAKPFNETILAAKIKAMQRIADMRQQLITTSNQLETLSVTDSLTGLYNRFQFDKFSRDCLLKKNMASDLLAVMFIDLDNFKTINDKCGHHVGDLLLQQAALRLRQCLRRDDFIARIGGDEFSVILTNVTSQQTLKSIADTMLHVFSQDFALDGHHVRVGISIGIAYVDANLADKSHLIQHADTAMYHAKSFGKNNYQFYSEKLAEKYQKQVKLEYDLKFAIDRDELMLMYQPIYQLQERKLVGFEVLLRWNHPLFGMVLPNQFIPIAEKSGLIKPIHTWILEKTCQQVKAWALPVDQQFKLSINVSSQQLSNEKFYADVVGIFEANQVAPHQIEFEITEVGIEYDDNPIYRDTIQQLHALGIELAIDNFRAGYEALTHLKQLSINALKIDRIFIQDLALDPNAAIIISCFISIGKNMGMRVVAKGIETAAQLDYLTQLGCPYGQGFMLGKAVSADQASLLLR